MRDFVYLVKIKRNFSNSLSQSQAHNIFGIIQVHVVENRWCLHYMYLTKVETHESTRDTKIKKHSSHQTSAEYFHIKEWEMFLARVQTHNSTWLKRPFLLFLFLAKYCGNFFCEKKNTSRTIPIQWWPSDVYEYEHWSGEKHTSLRWLPIDRSHWAVSKAIVV